MTDVTFKDGVAVPHKYRNRFMKDGGVSINETSSVSSSSVDVDSLMEEIDRKYVKKSGDTMNGDLTVKQELEVLGDVSVNGTIDASMGFRHGSDSGSASDVVLGDGSFKALSEIGGGGSANCLPLSGGTMTGDIDMGGNSIDNVFDINVNGVKYDGSGATKEGHELVFDCNNGQCAFGIDDADVFYVAAENAEIDCALTVKGALDVSEAGFKNGSSDDVVLGDGSFKALSEITAIADADTLDGEHADGFVRAGAINSGTLNSLGDKSFIKSVNTSGDDAPYSYNDWYHCIQMAHRNGYADGADYVGQILVGMLYHPSEMWFRGSRNGKWVSVVSSANIGYQTVNSIRDNSYHDIEHRRGTANNVFADGSLRYYLATSTMSSATGKPKSDAHILHCSWDNGNWDSQLALLNSGNGIQFRGQYRKSDDTFAWSDWKDVITSDHLSVDDSGNIGIGTTPEYKLDVNGTTRTTNLIVTDTLSYDNLTVSGMVKTPRIEAGTSGGGLTIDAGTVSGIGALSVGSIKVGDGTKINKISIDTAARQMFIEIDGQKYRVALSEVNQ